MLELLDTLVRAKKEERIRQRTEKVREGRIDTPEMLKKRREREDKGEKQERKKDRLHKC